MVAGTGGCFGALVDAVAFGSVLSRDGDGVGSFVCGTRRCSGLRLGKGKGYGDADTAVTEALCALYIRRG